MVHSSQILEDAELLEWGKSTGNVKDSWECELIGNTDM